LYDDQSWNSCNYCHKTGHTFNICKLRKRILAERSRGEQNPHVDPPSQHHTAVSQISLETHVPQDGLDVPLQTQVLPYGLNVPLRTAATHTRKDHGPRATSFKGKDFTYAAVRQISLELPEVTQPQQPQPVPNTAVTYRCDKCDYSDANKRSFGLHVLDGHDVPLDKQHEVTPHLLPTDLTHTEHLGQLPEVTQRAFDFPCKGCDYAFASKRSLKRHVRSRHAKASQCDPGDLALVSQRNANEDATIPTQASNEDVNTPTQPAYKWQQKFRHQADVANIRSCSDPFPPAFKNLVDGGVTYGPTSNNDSDGSAANADGAKDKTRRNNLFGTPRPATAPTPTPRGHRTKRFKTGHSVDQAGEQAPAGPQSV
jgi:hypothetical protein